MVSNYTPSTPLGFISQFVADRGVVGWGVTPTGTKDRTRVTDRSYRTSEVRHRRVDTHIRLTSNQLLISSFSSCYPSTPLLSLPVNQTHPSPPHLHPVRQVATRSSLSSPITNTCWMLLLLLELTWPVLCEFVQTFPFFLISHPVQTRFGLILYQYQDYSDPETPRGETKVAESKLLDGRTLISLSPSLCLSPSFLVMFILRSFCYDKM